MRPDDSADVVPRPAEPARQSSGLEARHRDIMCLHGTGGVRPDPQLPRLPRWLCQPRHGVRL